MIFLLESNFIRFKLHKNYTISGLNHSGPHGVLKPSTQDEGPTLTSLTAAKLVSGSLFNINNTNKKPTMPGGKRRADNTLDSQLDSTASDKSESSPNKSQNHSQINPPVVNILTNLGSPFIIGGDWNAKHKFWNNFTANKAGNTLFNHYQTHRYRIVYPEDFTFQSGKCKPSTLDFFLTDVHQNLDCTITEDFNTNHRPVMIMPANSTLTHNLHSTTDWNYYKNLTNKLRITHSFRTNQDIDCSITELTNFLHASRIRAKIPTANPNHDAQHYNDVLLQSYISHRRAIRKRGQLLAAHIVSDQMKDITATIKKRIAYLRAKKWDLTLRSFKKPYPTL